MGWEELYIQQGGEVYIEWDHLIQRFKTPLTASMKGSERAVELLPSRGLESYDVLASRARVLTRVSANSWEELCGLIIEDLTDTLASPQLQQVQEELQKQFQEQEFPVVNRVALPHLMVPGLTRHEFVVVRPQKPLSTLDPTSKAAEAVVVLVGPKDVTEHLEILASLSHRAQERLADDLLMAETESTIRETLLRHDTYASVLLKADVPSQELAGKSLWQLGDLLPKGSLVSQVTRDGKSFVPGGNSKLKLGDRLLILGDKEATSELYLRYVKSSAAEESQPATLVS